MRKLCFVFSHIATHELILYSYCCLLGLDELGRRNHERACKINAALQALGFKTWFDEQHMKGDIKDQMIEGIDCADLDDSDLDSAVADIAAKILEIVSMKVSDRLALGESAQESESAGTVTDNTATTSLVVSAAEAKREMIAKMVSWFIREVGITPDYAERYAIALQDKGIGKIERLTRRLKREPNFLRMLPGFEAEDIEDICEKLGMSNNASAATASNSSSNTGNSQSPVPNRDAASAKTSQAPSTGITHIQIDKAARREVDELLTFDLSLGEALSSWIASSKDRGIARSFQDVLSLGFSVAELRPHLEMFKQKGLVDIAQLYSLGCTLADLKLFGYSAIEMRTQLDVGVSALTDIGFAKRELFSVEELKNKGVPLQKIKELGFTQHELAKCFPSERSISGECLRTLTGHSNAVSTVIQLSDGSICSGSLDKSLKIWA